MLFVNLFNRKIKTKDVCYEDGTSLDEQTRTYVIIGSIVKNVSSSSAQIHTFAEIQTMFQNKYGVKPSGPEHIGASYMNGDGSAQSAHVEGATILNSIFYAVFDKTVSGGIRINYCYIYVA